MCRGAHAPKLPAGAAGPGVLPLGCELLDVAAVSQTDVWAVGARIGQRRVKHAPAASESLVEHWDGRHWRVVAVPDVGGLDAVVAVNGHDVWAASRGRYAAAFGRGGFLHWNGMTWRRVPAPAKPGTNLLALSASGPADVWALGSTGGGHGVVDRWDGHVWRTVAIPPLARLVNRRDVELTGVIARNRGDVWVVGVISPRPRPHKRDFTHALVLHWDGHRWQRLLGPHPGRDIDSIAAAGLDASGRVWLGGTFETNRPNGHIIAFGALLAVRVGGRWVTRRLPGSYRNAYTPVSIAGARRNDVWAVGSGEWASGRFVGHWNGRAWSLNAFQPRGQAITPFAVTTLTRSNAWLVGAETTPPARLLPVALHWNGHVWVPSPIVR
jgi:hypothetical protein